MELKSYWQLFIYLQDGGKHYFQAQDSTALYCAYTQDGRVYT